MQAVAYKEKKSFERNKVMRHTIISLLLLGASLNVSDVDINISIVMFEPLRKVLAWLCAFTSATRIIIDWFG